MYVRQLAWLWTRGKNSEVARAEGIEDVGAELPNIGSFDYIIEALTELGPAKQSANGPEGITWGDLEAYTARTGVDFDGWESVQLVRLSGMYAGAVRRYDGEDESPPMQSEDRQEARLKEMQAYLRGVKVEDGRRS